MKYLVTFFLLFCSLEAANRVEIPQNIQGWEMQLAQDINAQRAKQHLPPLTMRDNLCKLAKQHSQNMASGQVDFGHGGFDKRAQSIMNEKKHSSFGENVAYSYRVKDHLQTAIEGWMNSKGHRENILGDFNETGIGIAFNKEGYCYLTQLFAKRRTK